MFCLLEFVLTSRFNILVGTSLYFAETSEISLEGGRTLVFRAKLAFTARISLKKYGWYVKIHFQFHFFAIWSISASILSIIAWKAPASIWFSSELAMFLDVLGRSVNVKVPNRFLCRRTVFSDDLSLYSAHIRENTNQKISEFQHFSRSVTHWACCLLVKNIYFNAYRYSVNIESYKKVIERSIRNA